MKKIRILSAVLLTLISLNAKSQSLRPNIVNEKLTYDVMFKWGFIEKTAGIINLITQPEDNSDYFRAIMTGRSVDLADNIYTVRDTLLGRISKIDIQPVLYERIAHEGGGFYRDKVEFTNDGAGNVTGTATSYRRNSKGEENNGNKLMTATGITLDMLSALYYTRYIDYESMKAGESMVFNIFSGTKQERLKITYHGKTSVNVPAYDDRKMPVYNISFTFTYNDKDQKKSSDPIQAWIGTDKNRFPYQLTGKLPIGAIKCVLSNFTFNL